MVCARSGQRGEAAMPYAMFHERFPKVAEGETRTLTIAPWSNVRLPPRDYTFLEMYCDEPGCDCRRVFFNVFAFPPGETVAVIAYGWESLDYYAKWLGYDDPQSVRELKGPTLSFSCPQSKYAPAILALFKDFLMEDEEYMERIKRHYRMFRDAIDAKAKKARRRKR